MVSYWSVYDQFGIQVVAVSGLGKVFMAVMFGTEAVWITLFDQSSR